MEGIGGLILITVAVARLVMAASKPATTTPAREPLCFSCANLLIMRTTNKGKLLTYCDRNAKRERIKSPVVECSSFRPREPETGTKHVCGFACGGCSND